MNIDCIIQEHEILQFIKKDEGFADHSDFMGTRTFSTSRFRFRDKIIILIKINLTITIVITIEMVIEIEIMDKNYRQNAQNRFGKRSRTENNANAPQ